MQWIWQAEQYPPLHKKKTKNIHASHLYIWLNINLGSENNLLFIQHNIADAGMWVICLEPEAWKPLEAINAEWFTCSHSMANMRSWPADRQTKRATWWLKENTDIQGVKAHRKSL